MNLKNIYSFALIILATATISACSHAPVAQEYPDTASASEELTKFEADMQTAVVNQVNVLAPYNFEQADQALKNSKVSLDKQKKAKDTLHSIAEGRAYFNRANEFAQVSHNNIEEVIVARKQAMAAGAHLSQSVQFREADETLRSMTSNVEKNDLKLAISSRTALQLVYLDLELKSIKQARLGTPRERITQAVKEGAKEFAPRSLAIAEKSMADTDAYITANRHNADQIAVRSDETSRKADHLLKITRNSKSGKKTSSEDMALQMESEQTKVADKQGQLNTAAGQLANKQNQLDSKQTEVDKSKSANSLLAAENSDLESEQAFNRRFEEARREFTESEAQVYKQGNTLTIRLKGLEFPASQAVLKGSNFPLLAKVQKVIKSFGTSTVIVEGHTDSNGGKVLNEKLSTDRAQAVKEYLVANSNETMNIKAVGYDFQKPLATNKSSTGRAQNRRVDIVIQPEVL